MPELSNQFSASAVLQGEGAATLGVLHIDDSLDDLTLFEMAAQQAGVPLACHGIDSAAKAMAYLQGLLEPGHEAETAAWPDLVLLDIIMPGGTGFELLTYLRATPAFQNLPVITFSGDINPYIRDEAYRLGANSCLRKPLGFVEMTDLARALYEFWSLAQLPALGPRRLALR